MRHDDLRDKAFSGDWRAQSSQFDGDIKRLVTDRKVHRV
jgi:hypothetical protein